MKKMKLGMTALAICAMQLLVSASPIGNRSIPRAVSSAFNRQYPGAHIVNSEERNNQYIVNFRAPSESASAYYMSDGTWLRTDTKLAAKQDLPERVQEGLAKSEYGKFNVEQLDKVRQPDGKGAKTVYMLRVNSGADVENDRVLYFDATGRLETVTAAPDQQSAAQ